MFQVANKFCVNLVFSLKFSNIFLSIALSYVGQDLITSTSLIGGNGGAAFSDKTVFEQNGQITALKLCLRREITAITG